MSADVLREDIYYAYRHRLEKLLNIQKNASDQDIHDLIKSGFSAGRLKALFQVGAISPSDRTLIISAKSLNRRLVRGKQLAVDESDRLFLVIHIIAMAEAIFGEDEKSRRWLSKSKSYFLGNSPMAMLSTTQGARQVEEVLIQLAEGLAF